MTLVNIWCHLLRFLPFVVCTFQAEILATMEVYIGRFVIVITTISTFCHLCFVCMLHICVHSVFTVLCFQVNCCAYIHVSNIYIFIIYRMHRLCNADTCIQPFLCDFSYICNVYEIIAASKKRKTNSLNVLVSPQSGGGLIYLSHVIALSNL